MEKANWNKLTDCRFYLQNSCRYTSETCLYRHSTVILETQHRIVCPKWDRYECYDVACQNYHPASLEDLTFQYQSRSSKNLEIIGLSSNEEERKGRAPSPISDRNNSHCIYFMRGKCTKGHQCPFLHETTTSTSHIDVEEDRSQHIKRKAANILNKHSFKKSVQHIVSKTPRLDENLENIDHAGVIGTESVNIDSSLCGETKELSPS